MELSFDLDGTFGPVADPDQLTSSVLRDIHQYVSQGRNFGATFVEARIEARESPIETIVLDIEYDRVQRPAYDLKRIERVAIVVGPSGWPPTAFAVREDFPLVPHLNESPPDGPKSLCLYDRAWPDVRVTWTAGTYIQRIRWWFASTAEGSLHDAEQALEPFFFPNGIKLLVSRNFLADLASNEAKAVSVSSYFVGNEHSDTLILSEDSRSTENLRAAPREFQFVVLPLRTDPHTHGRVRTAPRRLSELHHLLAPLGVDLVPLVRRSLREWGTDPGVINRRLAILVEIPLRRADGHEAETVQLRAFLSQDTIASLGESLGVFLRGPKGEQQLENVISLRVPEDTSSSGTEVQLVPAAIGLEFDRQEAAELSGNPPQACPLTLVGGGSLGSALLENMARGGFGRWTIVDHDRLETHNLARHTLGRADLGSYKAEALASRVRDLLGDVGSADSIVTDVLTRSASAEIREVFGRSALVVDATASAAVLRSFARDIEAETRFASVFLVGNADALVLLMEDGTRSIRLDDLEAGLVRRAVEDDRLAAIFERRAVLGATLASCRAPTNRTSWSTITALAGVAASRLLAAFDGQTAKILVADSKAGGPAPFEVDPVKFHEMRFGDWTAALSDELLAELVALRRASLPSETGGALFGSFDAQHKRIYILTHLSGFPDDVGTPTGFARGRAGLKARMDELSRRTAGSVAYLGEWHSHPDGAALKLSGDDATQLLWLRGVLQLESRPALSLIVGATGGECYLAEP